MPRRHFVEQHQAWFRYTPIIDSQLYELPTLAPPPLDLLEEMPAVQRFVG